MGPGLLDHPPNYLTVVPGEDLKFQHGICLRRLRDYWQDSDRNQFLFFHLLWQGLLMFSHDGVLLLLPANTRSYVLPLWLSRCLLIQTEMQRFLTFQVRVQKRVLKLLDHFGRTLFFISSRYELRLPLVVILGRLT